MTHFSFESAYRQLAAHDRAFVDDFVARVERIHDATGRDMSDVLQGIDVAGLPPRDQEHLSRSLVRVAIQDRVQEIKDDENVSLRRITKRLAAMAFSSIDDFRVPGATGFDAGSFDLDVATPEQRSAIKKIKIKESVRGGTSDLEFELHDSMRAITLLCQLRGYLDGEGEANDPRSAAIQGGIPSTATHDEAQDSYAALRDAQ